MFEAEISRKMTGVDLSHWLVSFLSFFFLATQRTDGSINTQDNFVYLASHHVYKTSVLIKGRQDRGLIHY